jgi:molybdenum cofactor guanylyltransferase
MGTNKASLRLDDHTLVERSLAILRQCFTDVWVITEDDAPGLGPIGGIATALRRAPAIFVVACDMPFLDSDLIRDMAGLLPGYDAVAIPGEPLHAAYDARILPVIERQIAGRNYSMIQLLSRLRVKAVSSTGWQHALTNINTPQEWEAAKRYGQ